MTLLCRVAHASVGAVGTSSRGGGIKKQGDGSSCSRGSLGSVTLVSIGTLHPSVINSVVSPFARAAMR